MWASDLPSDSASGGDPAPAISSIAASPSVHPWLACSLRGFGNDSAIVSYLSSLSSGMAVPGHDL